MIEGRVKSIGLDPDKVATELGVLAVHLPKALGVAMKSAVGMLVKHTTKEKLRGQVLRRRTGTLIRSVTASQKVTVSKEGVVGSFGTNLWYGVAHEQGFTGSINVPAHSVGAHTRQAHTVRAHRVRAHQRTSKKGRTYEVPSYIVAEHSVGAANVGAHPVRAHAARVNYRARYYLSSTLNEKSGEILLRVKKAVWYLKKYGKVPPISVLSQGAGSIAISGD